MRFGLLLLIFQATVVWGAEYEIERSQEVSKRVALIELVNGTKVSSVGDLEFELKVRVLSKEQELIYNEAPVVADANDQTLYSLKVKPQGTNDLKIELTLVDGYGVMSSETMLLKWVGPPPPPMPVPQISPQPESVPVPQARKPFSPSLGFSLQSYEENGVAQFSQSSLSVKVGYSQLIRSGFDLGLNAFLTPMVLSGGTQVSGETIRVRFFGSNLRLGYTPTWPIEKTGGRLIASLMLGGYWTTTTATQDLIGFKNMIGPQVFPVLRFKVTDQIVVAGYYKFSPIFAGSSFSFSSKETAFGFSSTFYNVLKDFPLTFSLDSSALDVNFDDAYFIKSSSNTFSFGILF